MRCFSEGHGKGFFFLSFVIFFFSSSKTHQTMMDDKGSRRWNVSTFTAVTAQLEKPTRFFFLTRLAAGTIIVLRRQRAKLLFLFIYV